MSLRSVLPVVVLALVLAACGDDTGSDQPAATSPASTTAATTSASTTTGPNTTGPTTVTSTTTTAATTTTLEATPLPGTWFADPQGSYEMVQAGEWEANHGFIAAEIEFWIVGEIENGFAPNLNLLTQVVGAITLDEYVQLSIDSAPFLLDDFELIDAGVVEGAFGHELGYMDYAGSAGGPVLRFLGYFFLDGDRAVIATLTAPPETFDELRAAVEPYMLTIRRP